MPFHHLTIRRVETIPIRVPLRQVYRGSHYQMTHRATILTRIYTDEGITGEAFVGDEDHINDQIERAIRNEVSPRLIGEDGFATERCWELARPATFNILSSQISFMSGYGIPSDPCSVRSLRLSLCLKRKN